MRYIPVLLTIFTAFSANAGVIDATQYGLNGKNGYEYITAEVKEVKYSIIPGNILCSYTITLKNNLKADIKKLTADLFFNGETSDLSYPSISIDLSRVIQAGKQLEIRGTFEIPATPELEKNIGRLNSGRIKSAEVQTFTIIFSDGNSYECGY